MISLTESAINQIRSIIQEPDNQDKFLRIYVQGGGCSGFEYGFALETIQNEDDFDVGAQDVKVVVDAMSMQYLTGSVVDYVEELIGARFTIENPGAETTCGCGSSFSYDMDYAFDDGHDVFN